MDDIDLEKRIKQFIVKRLNLPMKAEKIDSDESLFGGGKIGLDSIDALELIIGMQENFGLKLPDDINYESFKTVNSIKKFVKENVSVDILDKILN